jgi:hypothetical protein
MKNALGRVGSLQTSWSKISAGIVRHSRYVVLYSVAKWGSGIGAEYATLL